MRPEIDKQSERGKFYSAPQVRPAPTRFPIFTVISMDNLFVKYNTYAKVLVPQPIRMTNAKWAGSPEKMEDGSEPQPWHCLPFVEGSTYGVELIYPYETECQ